MASFGSAGCGDDEMGQSEIFGCNVKFTTVSLFQVLENSSFAFVFVHLASLEIHKK